MFGFRVHLLLFIHLFYSILYTDAENLRNVFCANSACSELISEAQGKILYYPSEKYVLPFKKGTKVMIFGKCKEKNGYWLGKIGKNLGFVPSEHLKEVSVWKTSDMLNYEVPLSIENNKLFVNVIENNNLGQENLGTNPLPDTKPNTLDVTSNGSAGIPLSNLIHGDIPTQTSESLQEQVKIEPQVQNLEAPDPEVEPTGTVADNFQTILPSDVINELSVNVNQNNEQKPNEQLKFAEASFNKKPLEDVINNANNDVGENSEDINLLSKSSVPNQFYPEKSDVIINSNSNLGSKVTGKEEPMDTAEPRGVEYTASDDTLSNVKNVNEKLGENLRGNVVGSMDIHNSTEELKEMSTNSSPSMVKNDTYNISISSTSSSSSDSGSTSSSSSISSSSVGVTNSDDNSQKSSSSGISNNSQNPDLADKNILNNKYLYHNLVPEAHETTDLHVKDKKPEIKISENQNTNINLLQNIQLNGNAVEGNIAQNNIPPFPVHNMDQSILEHTINLSETPLDTINANRDMPTSSINDGINTGESISSISNIISSASSSFSSTSIVASSISNTNDYETPNGNPKFSDATAEQLDKENTVTYQDPEQVRKDPLIRNAVDGISAGATQFDHTPPNEIMNENIEYLSTNEESLTVQASEEQSSVFNTITPSVGQPVLSETADRLVPTTVSSQKDRTEKFQFVVPVEGTTEKLNYELPVQESIPPFDSVTQNTEDNVSEDIVTETPVPAPSTVDNSVEENSLRDDFSSPNTGDIGFFSKVTGSLLSWIGLGDKATNDDESEMKRDEIINGNFIKDESAEKLTQERSATVEGSCESVSGSDVNCKDTPLEESKAGYWNIWTESKNLDFSSSSKTLMYLVVTAVTVLLFTLGYYFIEKFHSDGPLIAKVNKLEQELLISSKECLILKDELTNTKEKLNLFETSSNDKIITALQLELEESKKAKSMLENNIEVLQQELDAATEAGLDLNRMLSEVLTQSGGSETLMKSVEHLQSQLNNQQQIIDEMTTKLVDKTKENQELQNELSAACEKIEGLESEIEDTRENLNVHLKDNEEIIKNLTSKNNEMHIKINKLNEAKEKEVLKLQNVVADLEIKVKSVSDSLNIKVEECKNLKESVKKIKMKDKNIDSLFEVSRIKAELSQSTSENTSLKERLKTEEEKLVKLENKVKTLDEEIQKLKSHSAEAQKEKLEAQTRLEVLSNYFKEKETQLQKELGLKEAMWIQKQGDDSTIYERIKSLEEEINSYKSQNDALKKEILDQERSLKAQIATLEKKAHDNWIAARQAERRLEESKQEGAQLRNKLTLLEKNMSNDLESSQHHRTGEEVNGGDSLSPLIHDTSSPLMFPPPLPLDPNNTALMPPGFIPPPMFMPPPPGGFMPPPPPFLPGDHRPPPLGRMSSPPLNNRFSPPPPEYAYDRISTPPMSPSSRNYRSNESDRERFRHRTPTSPSFRSRNWQESPTAGMSGFRPITSERDTRREHKGGSNLSSGHSSDSLDKSSRHSSRV